MCLRLPGRLAAVAAFEFHQVTAAWSWGITVNAYFSVVIFHSMMMSHQSHVRTVTFGWQDRTLLTIASSPFQQLGSVSVAFISVNKLHLLQSAVYVFTQLVLRNGIKCNFFALSSSKTGLSVTF